MLSSIPVEQLSESLSTEINEMMDKLSHNKSFLSLESFDRNLNGKPKPAQNQRETASSSSANNNNSSAADVSQVEDDGIEGEGRVVANNAHTTLVSKSADELEEEEDRVLASLRQSMMLSEANISSPDSLILSAEEANKLLAAANGNNRVGTDEDMQILSAEEIAAAQAEVSEEVYEIFV